MIQEHAVPLACSVLNATTQGEFSKRIHVDLFQHPSPSTGGSCSKSPHKIRNDSSEWLTPTMPSLKNPVQEIKQSSADHADHIDDHSFDRCNLRLPPTPYLE
jgi:hypothetical protein